MPYLKVEGKRLEFAWLGPGPEEAPTLVFLHEGLGSVSLWRDFPERLSLATGCGAFVYSRAGYGDSDPAMMPRQVRFMHDEALHILPQLLDAMAIRNAILVGHSDGGSIAIIHAGGTKDPRLRGLLLEAPHVFVEETGLNSIRAIADDYRRDELKRRLERYHQRNVDSAFWGWNDVWLDPAFASWNIEEYLPQINLPVLVIQGEGDEYGTLEQVRAIERGCGGPVRAVVLSNCGHSPHVDRPLETLDEMKKFLEFKSLTTLS